MLYLIGARLMIGLFLNQQDPLVFRLEVKQRSRPVLLDIGGLPSLSVSGHLWKRAFSAYRWACLG